MGCTFKECGKSSREIIGYMVLFYDCLNPNRGQFYLLNVKKDVLAFT